MVFIFLLFFCTFYFYIIKNYKPSFISYLPAFIVYFLIAGLQYNVGTDYPSYIYIYENPWTLERYFNSGEFFFYYSNIILSNLELPPQFIFILFSFIQSVFIFLYFIKLRKYHITLWLFFALFITVTNIYNNQLNLIRQYAALTLLPLLTISLYEQRYKNYITGCLLAMTFHSTAIVFFTLFFIKPFIRFILRHPFLLFILSLPFFLLLSQSVPFILEITSMKYSSYLEGDFFQPLDISTIITKLYYLPLILYFFITFNKNKQVHSSYLNFCIAIFIVTFWSFTMGLDIPLLSRLASYFWFFVIFPLFYLLINALQNKKTFEFLFIFIYCTLPYLAKVTFLAKAEFLYQSYIFN
ncbi:MULTISPECIES: EpsG family protein [Providencia]|uniref:EpsG family protein n=1 Tax=Providencia TaxID=586 RepID=UPI000E3E0944|nr:EpsG family protein [Providencia rettgeri]